MYRFSKKIVRLVPVPNFSYRARTGQFSSTKKIRIIIFWANVKYPVKINKEWLLNKTSPSTEILAKDYKIQT